MRVPMVALAAVLAACSEELVDEAADAGASPAAAASKVTTAVAGDGTATTRVDATAEAAWVAIDLDAVAEVDDGAAAFDLAFQRVRLKVNGGTSGAGEVAIAAVPGADFAAMTAAPAEGWTTDTAEARAFEAGEGWYAYDPATHVVTPRPTVWAVRSSEGAYFKLQLVAYYDEAGSSGYPRFRWAPIAPPTGSALVGGRP